MMYFKELDIILIYYKDILFNLLVLINCNKLVVNCCIILLNMFLIWENCKRIRFGNLVILNDMFMCIKI